MSHHSLIRKLLSDFALMVLYLAAECQSSCRREINLYNCMILYKASIWDICELILPQGMQDVYDFLHLKTPEYVG